MNTKYYELSGFNSVRVNGAVRFTVINSGNFKVSVVSDDPDHVKAEQIGETLVLGRRGIDWLLPFHMQPEFRVEMPELVELRVSGASQGEARGFVSSKDIECDISGASHVEINDISAANAAIKVSGASHVQGGFKVQNKTVLRIRGASHVDLSGHTGAMKLDVEGASHAGLGEFQADTAEVKLSGASHATVDVTGTMNTDLDGASDLNSIGSPQMGTIAVSGASSIRHK